MALAAPVVRGGRACTAVAVLPLENLSGNPQQEYFADGVHDALITALVRRVGLPR